MAENETNNEWDPLDTSISPQPGPQTILLAVMFTIPEIFFGGALASGKSYALGLAVEAQRQRYGKHVSAIIFRQSVPELEDLIKSFKEILEPFGWEYFTGRKTFKHPDGAECRMRHLEDEKDIRKYWGHAFTFIGVDELGDFSEKSFAAIQKLRAARLRSAHGVPVVFIGTGNPCGIGHKYCKERYVDPAPPFTPFLDPQSKHATIYIPGKMANNIKMLLADPTYRQRCQSMGPSWYVEALINGDWSKSPEGKMFLREWFNNRFDLNNPPNFDYIVISWDTAFKTTKDSAESAATTWGVTKTGNYLLDAFSEKLEFPELKAKALSLYQRWNATYVWVEDKASGPSLVQSVKGESGMPIKAISVDGDKVRRACVVTPFFESGKVFLPYSAPWIDKYVEQLCSFPAPTGLADLVDSTSQALTEIQKMKKRFEFFASETNIIPFTGSFFQR